MRIRFLNPEKTLMRATRGYLWWKKTADIRLVPWAERYKETYADPHYYRYVESNDPLTRAEELELYRAMYYAEKPERLAREREAQKQREKNWKKVRPIARWYYDR